MENPDRVTKYKEYLDNPFELMKNEKIVSPQNYKDGVKLALDEMHSEIERAVRQAAKEIDEGKPVEVTIPLAHAVRWADRSSPAMRLYRNQFPKAMKDISELCIEEGLKPKIQLNDPFLGETAADCSPASLTIAFSKSDIQRRRKPTQSISSRISYLAKTANSGDIACNAALLGFAGVATVGLLAGGAYILFGGSPDPAPLMEKVFDKCGLTIETGFGIIAGVVLDAAVTNVFAVSLKHHSDTARKFTKSAKSPAERFGKRTGLGILAGGWITNLAVTSYLYLTTPGFNFSDPQDGVVTHALAQTAGVALKVVLAAGTSVIVAGHATNIAAEIVGFVSELGFKAIKGTADGIRSLHRQHQENQETKLQF